jgi:chemotaxis protein CheD
MARIITVGMSEIKIACDKEVILVALGLGSCIGVCAYDRQAGIAGMAHIVLPSSQGNGEELPGKYADTAVPALLTEMQRQGAVSSRLGIAVIGGAQLFAFSGANQRLEIGERNTKAVKAVLKQHRCRIAAQDTGGNAGRTVRLFTADGRVNVKTIGQGERDLVLFSAPHGVTPASAA